MSDYCACCVSITLIDLSISCPNGYSHSTWFYDVNAVNSERIFNYIKLYATAGVFLTFHI
jgi:hypothetical protein